MHFYYYLYSETDPEKQSQETELRRRRRVADVPPIPEPKTKNVLVTPEDKTRSRAKSPTNRAPENSAKSILKKIEPILKPKVQEVSKELLLNQLKSAKITEKHDATSSSIEFKDELERLKRDLEATKVRAERAERDKSDILLRRLASMDTG